MAGPEAPVVCRAFLNQVEPVRLIDAFMAHPPLGCTTRLADDGTPAFISPFDLLTTISPRLRTRLLGLPLLGRWLARLRVRTAFVGTTVTEYVPVAPGVAPARLAMQWRDGLARHFALCVVKDVPVMSPLLNARENLRAAELVAACRAAGFIVLAGQSLAYVPIDFDSVDVYLARLSASRRKDLRRKLRSRGLLQVSHWHTGDPRYDCDALVDACYALYDQTYAQSEIHFERLSRSFLAALLRDPDSGGLCVEYREQGELLGFNLCFVHDGMLVDKYIGLSYPAARRRNLYFVSWFVNLEYALQEGLGVMVAGWTDPQVKEALGASFTTTQHAVFIRNPVLRVLARCGARAFDGDSARLAPLVKGSP